MQRDAARVPLHDERQLCHLGQGARHSRRHSLAEAPTDEADDVGAQPTSLRRRRTTVTMWTRGRMPISAAARTSANAGGELAFPRLFPMRPICVESLQGDWPCKTVIRRFESDPRLSENPAGSV